jgi:hypothetical protein
MFAFTYGIYAYRASVCICCSSGLLLTPPTQKRENEVIVGNIGSQLISSSLNPDESSLQISFLRSSVENWDFGSFSYSFPIKEREMSGEDADHTRIYLHPHSSIYLSSISLRPRR